MTSPPERRTKRRKNLKSSRIARANWLYTRPDTLNLFGVCPNTLRNWVAQGLKPIEPEGKFFLGSDLNAFHSKRRKQVKKPCARHEVFCTACKSKHSLQEEVVKEEPLSRFTSRVSLKCPNTGKTCSSFVRKTVLDELRQGPMSKSSSETPD